MRGTLNNESTITEQPPQNEQQPRQPALGVCGGGGLKHI